MSAGYRDEDRSMITLSDALDGVKDARNYWDVQWVLAYNLGDQDRLDVAMAEKRALSQLAARLTDPKDSI